MNAKAILTGFVVGVTLAAGGIAAAQTGWAWYVDSEGEASGSLGALSPLDVSDARGGDDLLPGETLAIKVNIGNPNRVALAIVSVEIGDLKSGDEKCDESLADSRLRFDRTPDLTVQPGNNPNVVLGAVRLPKLLANVCQGRDVSAAVSARAAYGS